MALTNGEQTLLRELKLEFGESINVAETMFDPAVDPRPYLKAVLQTLRPLLVQRRNQAQAEADRITAGINILDGLVAKYP